MNKDVDTRSPSPVAAGAPISASGGDAQGPRQPLDPAVAELFSSLAHDLRSPIGVVSETIAQLGADFSGQLGDEHRVLIGLAERSVRRLTRIAESLSLMVALDAATADLRRSSVDLCDVARKAMDTAAGIETRREVKMVHELPEGGFLVDADGDRLARAVCEVVINALRYARKCVRVRVEVADDAARVHVEDDGQGVSPAARANLFRRLAGPRSSRSGLGIGLSLANDVITAHGASLSLEDSTLPPGAAGTQGARFVVSFPRV